MDQLDDLDTAAVRAHPVSMILRRAAGLSVQPDEEEISSLDIPDATRDFVRQ